MAQAQGESFTNSFGHKQALFSTQDGQFTAAQNGMFEGDHAFVNQYVTPYAKRGALEGVTSEIGQIAQKGAAALKSDPVGLGKQVIGSLMGEAWNAVTHPINIANGVIVSAVSSAKNFGEGVAASTNEDVGRQLKNLYGQDVTSAVRAATSAQGAIILGSALGAGKVANKVATVIVDTVKTDSIIAKGLLRQDLSAEAVASATFSTAGSETIIPTGIHIDKKGVYGYLPDEGSRYAGASNDFTDSVFVERNRQIRIGYLNESIMLENAIDSMRAAGYDSERIANRVVLQRNSQKIEARTLMTPLETQALELGNLERYGDAVGPTPLQLFSKYGNWETVIKKSMEKDAAINLLLGLPRNH